MRDKPTQKGKSNDIDALTGWEHAAIRAAGMTMTDGVYIGGDRLLARSAREAAHQCDAIKEMSRKAHGRVCGLAASRRLVTSGPVHGGRASHGSGPGEGAFDSLDEFRAGLAWFASALAGFLETGQMPGGDKSHA